MQQLLIPRMGQLQRQFSKNSEDSGSNANVMSENTLTCKPGVTGNNDTIKNNAKEVYCTRFVYNKNVRPSVVDALLAKKIVKCDSKATEMPQVKGRVVWSSVSAGCGTSICVKSPDYDPSATKHDSKAKN